MGLAGIWQTLAFPVVGAIVGLVLGLVVLDPDNAASTLGPWVLTVFGMGMVAAGSWYVFKRRRSTAAPRIAAASPGRRPPAPVPKPAGPAPAAAGPRERGAPGVAAALRFPAIADRHPDVWAVGQPLVVMIRVTRNDEPLLDAAVSLSCEIGGTRIDLGKATSGAEGLAQFRFIQNTVGDARLEAEVAVDGGIARTRRVVRFVQYEEEIRNVFDEFRAWVSEAYPEATDVLTVREMFQNLTKHFGPQAGHALMEVTKAYELVTYGERDATRETYEVVLDAFTSIEKAGVFEDRGGR